MYTIANITQRAFLRTENPNFCQEKSENTNGIYSFNPQSSAVQSLREFTTQEIESEVTACVLGQVDFKYLKDNITKETISQYLAAAKIADLLYPQNKMAQSTFLIRFECLKKDKEINKGTNATGINLVNAFGMPPENETDPLLLNQINSRHSAFSQLSAAESAKKRNVIYEYAQNQLLIHPEMAERMENIITIFYKSVADLNSELPKNTTTILRGCPGTGKTFSLKKFKLPSNLEMDLTERLYSTDRIMDAFMKSFQCSPDQTFLLGFSVRKELDANVKKFNPDFSILQEGWFKTESEINPLFIEGRKLEMRDFDGDLRLLELRILHRSIMQNAALTLDVIERSFREHRETRPYLIKKLRPEDVYQLQYTHNDGRVEILHADDLHNNIVDAQEMLNAKSSVITAADVALVGENLNRFLGKTIQEAFLAINLK